MAAPAPAPARAGGPCPLTQHQQHQQHQHPERPEGALAQLGGSLELAGVCLESCSAVPRLALEGPQGRAPLPTASPNALLSRCHCGALSYSSPPTARPAPAEVTGADQSAPGAAPTPVQSQGRVVAVPLAPAAFTRQPLLSAASLQEEFCGGRVTEREQVEVEEEKTSE